MIDDIVPLIATPLAYLFLACFLIVFIGEMAELVVVLAAVAAMSVWNWMRSKLRARHGG